MKLSNTNKNIKPVNLNNLLLSLQKLTIFSFLILFTAINTVLISFYFDIFVNNLIQWDVEDPLLIVNEVAPGFSIQGDLNTNRISIFNYFMNLFNKSHSKYRYFPSYFQVYVGHTDYILINKVITHSYIGEDIVINIWNSVITKEVMSYNQYLILEHYNNNNLNVLLSDICKILLEYKQNNSS